MQMQTETEKSQVKVGDRVEFRCYGFKQRYASGKVLRTDDKSVIVRVDMAMRNARVEWDDIVKVLAK
jgi:hypothetical protein